MEHVFSAITRVSAFNICKFWLSSRPSSLFWDLCRPCRQGSEWTSARTCCRLHTQLPCTYRETKHQVQNISSEVSVRFVDRRYSSSTMQSSKNYRFVFNRTWAIDVRSIIEFVQLVHDFLISGEKVRPSVYTFLVFLYRGVSSLLNGLHTLL